MTVLVGWRSQLIQELDNLLHNATTADLVQAGQLVVWLEQQCLIPQHAFRSRHTTLGQRNRTITISHGTMRSRSLSRISLFIQAVFNRCLRYFLYE